MGKSDPLPKIDILRRVKNLKSLFVDQRLRLVSIDYPKRVIEDDGARDLFSKILRLRIVGYGFEYPETVIPCDTSDFFGTHIAVCREARGRKLEPIMSFKMLSFARSKALLQTFYPIELARSSSDQRHIDAITAILMEAQAKQIDVGYCCSWTIHPEVRSNEPLVAALRDSVYLSHGAWQLENRVPEMIIAGVVRFKTPAYQQTIGYEPLTFEGIRLPEIPHPGLGGESIELLHMRQMSELTATFTSSLISLWKNRVEYSAKRLADASDAA